MMSKTSLLLLAFAGTIVAAPVNDLVRRGNLPTPVSAATARSYLDSNVVETPSNSPAYSRDYFKTWIAISGTCDTREYVLKRDGSNVQTNSACTATSGTWYSDYDGATWTAASDLDIDHLVPLKEAWISGARNWDAQKRQDFANDVTRPQLLAVTDNVNQSKGDRDIAAWLPSRQAYQCTYVRAWVQVKYYYGLSMDSSEMQTARNILNGC